MTVDEATLAAYAAHAREDADDACGRLPAAALQDAVRSHFRSGAAGGLTGDIGCGAGRDVDWLERHGYPCTGFDASDALLAEATRRFPDRRFARATLPELAEIAPRTFDNVVCESVLLHLPHDAVVEAIAALRRILVADGALYLRWPVEAVDRRDQRGRLHTAIDAAQVLDALAGMTILRSAETVDAASNAVHTIVARARGNAFNRKPRP